MKPSYIFFALFSSLLILIALAFIVDESPLVYWEAVEASLIDNQTGLWGTLGYTTTLLCTALAIQIPIRSGYFNIGAEGQMLMGGIGAYLFAHSFSHPELSLSLGILGAILFGGMWASIPAFLKAWRGVHEVVAGIFLNFIAAALLTFLLTGPWKDPAGWSPESPALSSKLNLYPLESSNGPSIILLLALISLPLLSKFIQSSLFGLILRALRKSKKAVRYSGFSPGRTLIGAAVLAGGFAGLAASHDVLAVSGKLKDSFSGGMGFYGIGVALLAGRSFYGLVFSALFFGALFQISTELQIVSERLSAGTIGIFQAAVIILVSISLAQSARKGRAA